MKDVKDVVHAIRNAPADFRYQRKEGEDWLVGEEAKDAVLEFLRRYYDATHPSFCVADEKATKGFLKWLEEDFADEEFTELHTLAWGLSVDEGGRARPTVTVRDRNLDPVGGVQLSPAETMKLCRWAWGIATANARADIYDPLQMEGVSYLREQVGEMLKDLQENLPEVVGALLDKAARDAICDMATKEASERVQARLYSDIRATEKRWAEQVVALASIATKDSDAVREKQLSDPMLQSYITKAVDLVADSERH